MDSTFVKSYVTVLVNWNITYIVIINLYKCSEHQKYKLVVHRTKTIHFRLL
jgi:hypothetical protein